MREVTNQFLSNARLYSSVLSDRLKCSSVLEEVTEVGSPFQMVGAAWLKKELVVNVTYDFCSVCIRDGSFCLDFEDDTVKLFVDCICRH